MSNKDTYPKGYIILARTSILTKFIWWEPIWIFVVSPLILLPGRLLPLVWQPYIIGILFLGWPVRMLAYHRLSIRTPLDWCIGLLLVWLPVNFWAAADKNLAWEHIGYLGLGISLYFAFINWPLAQKLPQLVAWLLISINMGLAFLGPFVLAYYPAKLFNLTQIQSILEPVARHFGETMHPNILCGALVMTAPLLAALVLSRNWHQAPLLLGLLGLGLLFILAIIGLTQSRGGYLGILAATGLLMILFWPRLLYILLLAALPVLASFYWIGSARLLDLLIANDTLGGLDGRVELWSRAIFVLRDFPFTGIGIGTFQKVVPILYPYLLLSPENAPHAHNLLLQIGVDLGLPGLIAYLGLLLNIFVMLSSILRLREYTLRWQLAAGASGGIIAMLVHGLLDAVTWGTKLAFIPWLFFALITLLFLQAQQVQTKIRE